MPFSKLLEIYYNCICFTFTSHSSMAYYAALLSTIELHEDILHPLRFPNSFDGNYTPTFNSLHKKFSHLLDSLQDYSSIGQDTDPLEARIKDASFRALDLIESQISEHQHASTFKKKLGMQIKKWLRPQVERFDWKEELEKVGREVDSIVEEVTALKQSQSREHVVVVSTSEPPPPLVEANFTVVGFEEQVLAIKEHLCGSSSQLQVIPIVGMGGIGKTTLARRTFDDRLIVYEFDFCGWVTISQDYHVVRVLQDIVKSLGIIVTPLDELWKQEIALKDGIHKHLKGRKFLVVIDDVWNTDVWDDIKHIFPNDGNGSRILLTTRLADVAAYVGSNDSLYQIQLLDENASWTLLQEKALGKECCPPQLVDIGRDIASKCGGLPLAIVVIGGILSIDKTLRFWESVAKNAGSILSKSDEHLSNILSLSYNHLPHHLKPCFLHMGSFPEDYEISISKLVRLWIGEGLLKSISKSKSLEEIGKDYLKDLVKRSLVIITGKKADGEFKSCVLHDLLRDFCKRRAHDEYFIHVMDQERLLETNSVEKVRRIALNSTRPFTVRENSNGKYVRAICWFSKAKIYTDLDDFVLKRVNLLRLLDAADLRTPRVPHAVSYLFHLKYLALNLDHPMMCYIDSSISISKFQNLETLIIHCDGFRTVTLPSEIWKMPWLKCVKIYGMRLPPVPPGIPFQKLEYLHTLQTLENFTITRQFIRMISNIRKLKLVYNSKITRDIWNWYGLNNLSNLLQLETLDVHFTFVRFSSGDLLWRGYVFPQNLKKLYLYDCGLPWEAMTLVGCLKYLEVLKLGSGSFVGQVWEPVEGEFLQLKFLDFKFLDLKQWKAESTHFPKLQHLQINGCEELEEIPLDIGEIGSLKSITVYNSKHAGYSANKILEEQRELGNYGLQVIVHSDDIN